MSSPRRRLETDVMKLMVSGYDVNLVNDSMNELLVKFKGPKETPFEGGVWKIRVEAPLNYPYKSPSIGFGNRIYHPNIDEGSGTVCLDVINQTWSPMFDLLNIFETFLPQLLRYPNASDPLNGDAASLLMRDPAAYDAKVREYVKKYATESALEDEDDEDDEDSENNNENNRNQQNQDTAHSDDGYCSSVEGYSDTENMEMN